MRIKIENWQLLVLSIFYIILAAVSFHITTQQFYDFFLVAGIVVAVFGLLMICAYFFKKDYLKPNEFSFSFGLMYILIGICVACKPDFIVANYPIVISALMVWDSALRMQYAMNLLRLQKGMWFLTFLMALTPMIAGMVLILVPMEETIYMPVFRVLLIVDAVANFITILNYKLSIRKDDITNTTNLLDIAKEEKNEIMIR